jgi:dihydropteroate synthase
MFLQMAIVNLTPDSFYEPSRVWTGDADPSRLADAALARIQQLLADGADIIDLGAVSTRPGAADVPVEEEWRRLEPVLKALAAGSKSVACAQDDRKDAQDDRKGVLDDREEALEGNFGFPLISIDTTSAEIVRRAYGVIGEFIVNDISAGEDDPGMLQTVAEMGLPYIAMHKRGNPRSMDSLCDYPDGIMAELLRYFEAFDAKASALGISDWILDPGLGFAKTEAQNWEILEKLGQLKIFGRPILIGAADKRFTRGNTAAAHELAIANGADILRVHQLL